MKVTFELDKVRKTILVKRDYGDNEQCSKEDISAFFNTLLTEVDTVTGGHLKEVVDDYFASKSNGKVN